MLRASKPQLCITALCFCCTSPVFGHLAGLYCRDWVQGFILLVEQGEHEIRSIIEPFELEGICNGYLVQHPCNEQGCVEITPSPALLWQCQAKSREEDRELKTQPSLWAFLQFTSSLFKRSQALESVLTLSMPVLVNAASWAPVYFWHNGSDASWFMDNFF